MTNPIIRFKDYLRLREAIEKADKAHRDNHERYYVMPTFGDKLMLLVMDRAEFRKMKQKHYIDRKATVNNLIGESFYFTPYPNGTGRIPDDFRAQKRKHYYSWCDAIRALRRRKKQTRRQPTTH